MVCVVTLAVGWNRMLRGATPSPDGTRIPGSSLIIDNSLATWTLGSGLEILRDGVQVANGYGSQILWFQGSIYVLGDDSNWWKWTGAWTFSGATDPNPAGPPPSDPPPSEIGDGSLNQ